MKNELGKQRVALMLSCLMILSSIFSGCNNADSSVVIESQIENSIPDTSSSIESLTKPDSSIEESLVESHEESRTESHQESSVSSIPENSETTSVHSQLSESHTEQSSISETGFTSENSSISSSDISGKEDSSAVIESNSGESSKEETSKVDDPQKDDLLQSLNMLNYLSFVSYEISSMKDTPTFLKNIYDTFLDSMSKKRIDNATVDYVSQLYDTIYALKLASSEKDHLFFYYEKEKTKALADAFSKGTETFSYGIGNISGEFNDEKKFSIDSHSLTKGLCVSIAGGITGVADYFSGMVEAEINYIKMIWKVSKQIEEALKETRSAQYRYQTEILQDANLKEYPELNDKLIGDFIAILSNKNTTIMAKIKDLENRKTTYQYFGNYWLELAQLYYSAGEYEKCINAVHTYEGLDIRIFIVDNEYLHVLPFSIASFSELYASEQCSKDEYVSYITEKLAKIRSKAQPDAWDIRYFAGQFYLELYRITDDPLYLHYAYDLIYKNVIALIGNQTELNDAYLSADFEADILEGTSKEDKKIIEEYNKSLREARKTELPPVYRPLTLNLDFLLDLLNIYEMKHLEVPEFASSSSEPVKYLTVVQAKNGLQRELHDSMFSLFLSQILESTFASGFAPTDMVMKLEQPNFVTKTTYLTLSAGLITDNTTISMTISKDGQSVTIDDWVVNEVKRSTDDFEDFVVVYTSERLKDHRWDDHENISISVVDKNITHFLPTTITFTVTSGDSPSNPVDTAKFSFQSAYIGTYRVGLKK